MTGLSALSPALPLYLHLNLRQKCSRQCKAKQTLIQLKVTLLYINIQQFISDRFKLKAGHNSPLHLIRNHLVPQLLQIGKKLRSNWHRDSSELVPIVFGFWVKFTFFSFSLVHLAKSHLCYMSNPIIKVFIRKTICQS